MVKQYRRTLADQVYELLRRRIVRLEMPPGHRFVERQIAQDTGFGGMPIREALDRLSQDRLVRTIPRHGYQVTVVDAKYVRDFIDVWAPVAVTLHRLALLNGSDEGRQSVLDAIQHFNAVQSDPQNSMGDVVDELIAMFDLIAEVADNEHLTVLWHRLSGVCSRVFHIASSRSNNLREGVDSELFMAAWRQKNVMAVTAVVESFVDKSRQALIGAFDEPEQSLHSGAGDRDSGPRRPRVARART